MMSLYSWDNQVSLPGPSSHLKKLSCLCTANMLIHHHYNSGRETKARKSKQKAVSKCGGSKTLDLQSFDGELEDLIS